MKTEREALCFVEEEARKARQLVVSSEELLRPHDAEASPLAVLIREQTTATVVAALENTIALIRLLPAELRRNDFKPHVLAPFLPNAGEDNVDSPVAGTYRHMQMISRTSGGFYTVLFALATAFSNLASLVEDPERTGELRKAATALSDFAGGAYRFYCLQLESA